MLPVELLAGLKNVPGFDEQLFVGVHTETTSVTSVRINSIKTSAKSLQLPASKKVPWATDGLYLTHRPSFTFDPSFHAGAYYVQEASSMFLEQAVKQLVDLDTGLKVLDLCAAPGGKSTHLLSLLNEQSVLVSNELIRNRVTILAENITKWGAANCIVSNNDPQQFAALASLFDVIVVDAPCSGSGLFRKDNEAITEWSVASVEHCSRRQQRILLDVWPALKPGGVLIYSTCSYSPEENEQITDWMTDETGAETVALSIEQSWNIVTTHSPIHKNIGYRFYPYLLDGEGFFMACFKKPGSEDDVADFKPVHYKEDKKLQAAAMPWLKEDNRLQFYRHEAQLFAMPAETLQLFLQLQATLNIRKAGVKVGDIARDEIIPDHALALSGIKSPSITTCAFNSDQAIAFLRRAEIVTSNLPTGWLMVTYKELAIGWIKSLGSRINNYYPKEWRIRT